MRKTRLAVMELRFKRKSKIFDVLITVIGGIVSVGIKLITANQQKQKRITIFFENNIHKMHSVCYAM